jgi:hypothetical protein
VFHWPGRLLLGAVSSLSNLDLVEAARRDMSEGAASAFPVPALSLDGNTGVKSTIRFRAGSLPTDWESFEVDIKALWDLPTGKLADSALSVTGLKRVVGANDLVSLYALVKSAAEGFVTSGDIVGNAWGLSYHLPSAESLLLR